MIVPAEAIPVGEFVVDELEARGWSTADAAARMRGELFGNFYWLELLTTPEIWEVEGIVFGDTEAGRLAELFGSSPDVWMNLHESYLQAKDRLKAEATDV